MIDIQGIKSKIVDFAEKHKIKFIVLFGSQVAEASKADSDFDVAVVLEKNKSIFADSKLYSELLDEFSKLFNVYDSIKIDLTDLGKANILLRYEIISNGLLLYGDEDEYAQFKAFSFRDYIDAKQLFDLESFLIKKRHNLIQEAIFSK